MTNLRNTARRLILSLYNIDEVYFFNEKERKISDAELSLMYALDDGNPHSQKDISKEWLIPKTTVNTIAKRWEREGLLIQVPIPGQRREKQMILTDAGKEYAKGFLSFLYEAEEKALGKTMDRYSDTFIEAIEYFGASLKAAFEEQAAGEDDCNGFTQR